MSDPVERFRAATEELARHSAGLSRAHRERLAALVELRDSGMPMQTIADQLGLTRSRIYQLLGDVGEKRRPGPKV